MALYYLVHEDYMEETSTHYGIFEGPDEVDIKEKLEEWRRTLTNSKIIKGLGKPENFIAWMVETQGFKKIPFHYENIHYGKKGKIFYEIWLERIKLRKGK